MSATDTIDVAALVERLRMGEGLGAAMAPTAATSRYVLAIMDEAATALQSQADALAEARRLVSASEAERYRSCGELLTRATAAEASLATMREALEYATMGLDRIHESLKRNGPKQASGEMTAHFLERARRALGGSNAE